MNIEFCCRADWLKRNGFQKPDRRGADLLWGEDRHWAEKKVGGDRSSISLSSSSPSLSFSSKLFSSSKLQISPRFCMKRIKPVQGRVGREEGAVCVEYSKVIYIFVVMISLWLHIVYFPNKAWVFFLHRKLYILKKTRHQLIPVRDILFAQPKVFMSWHQQGHIL